MEDVGSKGYVIGRDLNHLKQAGILDQASAILFGSFTGGDEHKQYAMQRFADSEKIPVFYADCFCHGKNNYPLPFGFISRIQTQKK